jgi:hypothetical protein
MSVLREGFRVVFVGGPWDGRCGTITAPLPPSVEGHNPKPTETHKRGEPMDAVYFWRGTGYQLHVDLDPLVSGPELDRMVEELVMAEHHDPAPHFSKSQSASGPLERALERLGWTREGKGSRPGAPPGVAVVVRLSHEDGRMVDATGKTFEEALCKVALKAVEP